MLINLAKHLVAKLLDNDCASEDEQELYTYGFFLLLSSLMFFIFACLVGAIFGCLLESIIFFSVFQLIRKYAGGFHAPTEKRCTILSTTAIITCNSIIKLSEKYDFKSVLLVVTLVATICIFRFCPLDTPEKPLAEEETKYFQKASWIITTAIVVVILISYFLCFDFLYTPCCLSILLESILLFIGKILKVHKSTIHF